MGNVIYPDVVIEKKYESVLSTKLDMQQFMNVDYSLSEDSGMIKKVITKTVSGNVEDLAMGAGNTEYVEVGTSVVDYEVGVTQGRFAYYDEEAMSDDRIVEAGLTGLAEVMVNDFTAKAIAEMDKASLQQAYTSSVDFDCIVDAIGLMNLEAEEGLFMLINPAMQAAFRKVLKDDLKYSEGFVRTGYIGHVCGVPVYISKAVPAGEAFIASKEAVTLFIKKGVERELDRNANIRQNIEYIRKVALVALTDARKIVKIGASQATAATITTSAKGAKAVAGAATTGATVEVWINGVLDGTAVAASSAYAYTAKANLVAGDEIKVIAKKAGCVDSSAEAVVAE